MEDPILSICIPTYNRAEIVYQCVSECLSQPYDWIEVVVTDNCSTDNTIEILSSIHDLRLKIYKNERNIGYVNLTKCLTNGHGKFCLLLSDEDTFVNADWESVRKQLTANSNAAVFQFQYEDVDGSLLIEPPEHIYKANEFLTFQRILQRFPYAGGLILQSDILNRCWGEPVRETYLWSLYNQTILPMKCACYGDYMGIKNLCARRSERNNKGTLDTKAWCSVMDEPYWSIKSRKQQNLEWIEFIYNFDADLDIRINLAEDIICNAIGDVCNYYKIVNHNRKEELFTKFQELIIRDKEIYKNRWIRVSLESYRMSAVKFNSKFGIHNRNYKKELKALLRMYVFFIKKYIKKVILKER